VRAHAFVPYPVHYPHHDWAEQDPDDWWHAIIQSTRQVMEQAGAAPGEIMAITHSTQLVGIIPIGPDGRHLRPAIIWLDGRAAHEAAWMMNKFLGPKVFAILGGAPLTGKDGLPKLLWLKNHEPEVYNRMTCFLDVNGYLVHRCTGRQVFEWSCASAFAFDLPKKDWLRGIIKYIGLDQSKFPGLVRSIDRVGGLTAEAAAELGLLEGTPVFGGCGDGQAAAVGSGATGEGGAHVYLGTSGWVGVLTRRYPTGKEGVVALQSADPQHTLLFAEMETAGACLKWIAEQFYSAEKADPRIPNVYALMDEKVLTIPPGSDSLICTPWMYGERCPVADTWVRSTFFNLSADHTREHMLRAVYEGVAYNLRWILEIVEKDFHFQIPVLRLIGGGALGAPWMQIIADVTSRRVETVAHPLEAGAVGVALTAAIGLGEHTGFAELKEVVPVGRAFEPHIENAPVYDHLYHAYHRLYGCLRELYQEVNEERFTTT
jgi:xylulokinase